MDGTFRASIYVSRKRAMLFLMAAALLVGVVSWAWGALALPGRTIIRGHVGDVAAVALVYSVIGLVARSAVCAIATVVVAVAIELAQTGASRGAAGDLLLGRHFDPYDLLAYAIGIALAVLWDRTAND